MDKFDRIFRLHHLLAGRRTPLSVADLQEQLECSKASVYRLLLALRDSLNAPLVKDSEGFRYDPGAKSGYELPGLWFTEDELLALLTFQSLLKNLDAGLLKDHLAPLEKRVRQLLDHRRLKLSEASRRVRFLATGARNPGSSFRRIVGATLSRHQLRLSYHARSTDTHSERTVSPQRVIHYRNNWYLDAWDHSREELRTFSTDRVTRCRELTAAAKEIPEAELDSHYATSYGIFSGSADKIAVLRFSPERARWVADEHWHPQQQGCYLDDGSYEVTLPYHDHRELLLDVLRHGAHVEVIAPKGLRDAIKIELAAAQGKYQD